MRLSFTKQQLEALSFACSNTLAEPANFEDGTENGHLEEPMNEAWDKISSALGETQP